MLSSLKSHEEGEESSNHHRHHHHHNPTPTIPAVLLPHARQLLITCADLVHRADIPAARRAISLLLSAASPAGDSTDRLVHQFARALSFRLDCLPVPDASGAVVQSSYLSFNQVTPFVRFAHLTANQAILEAVEGRRVVHIIDFDTAHGVQWPPLLQAIADRCDPRDPPAIRITGTGEDLLLLRRTGDRLATFAQSLGLPFTFHPLHSAGFTSASLQLRDDEALAVNCVHFLHNHLREDSMHELLDFLRGLKHIAPTVVAVAEKESGVRGPGFMNRFASAVDYYGAVFESLEATLPPASRERVAVEQGWLAREIAGVVAGDKKTERLEMWEAAMRTAGFTQRPLSEFALSQARLLLRLHYPSEGYQLQVYRDSFFLGWQQKPLFSVSSWH